jgi:hypothetical protein
VFLVLLAVYSRPIADDWSALSITEHAGFASSVSGSGRYSAQALIWIVVHAFGTTATLLTPVVLLIAIWAAGYWLVRNISRAAGASHNRWELTLLALLALVATISVAPSMTDNVAWLSGVGGYTAGVAAATALVACCWQFAASDPPASPTLAGVVTSIGAFLTAGFDELVAAVLVLAAIFALVMARILTSGRLLLRVSGAGGAGAAVGLALNMLNPATRSRASALHARIDLFTAARTAWHDLTFLSGPIRSGRALLVLAAGIFAWQLFEQAITPRVRRWIVAWGAFLLLVPWLVVSAGCAWANATESGDRAPFRAAFLFTSSAALGALLLVVTLLSLAPNFLTTKRATLLALVIAAGGLVALGDKAEPLIRAERMRIHVLALRATSVERQLSTGHSHIELLPAPLLTVDTQALDLSFATSQNQRAALVHALRLYYGIPRRDTVSVIARQPRSYCLPGVSAAWVGVQSCQELDTGH